MNLTSYIKKIVDTMVDRGDQYGPYNFKPDTTRAMIKVKLQRLETATNPEVIIDTWVDIAGYAILGGLRQMNGTEIVINKANNGQEGEEE